MHRIQRPGTTRLALGIAWLACLLAVGVPSARAQDDLEFTVRVETSHVWFVRGSDFEELQPDIDYPQVGRLALTTDPGGQALVRLLERPNDCGTIYVFMDSEYEHAGSGLSFFTCPRGSGGNYSCANSGTSAFQNQCASKFTVRTPSGIEVLEIGTWFSITYLPTERLSLLLLLDGAADVDARPADPATPGDDSARTIEEGAFWYSRPSRDEMAGVPLERALPLRELPPLIEELKLRDANVGRWMERIVATAEGDGVCVSPFLGRYGRPAIDLVRVEPMLPTTDREPTLTVTASETGAPLAEVEILTAARPEGDEIEYASAATCTEVDDGGGVTCSAALGSDLPVGPLHYRVVATDQSGNEAVQDGTLLVSRRSGDGPALEVAVSNAAPEEGALFSIDALAAGDGPAAVRIDMTVGSNLTVACPSDRCLWSGRLAAGSWPYTVRAVDDAQNETLWQGLVTVEPSDLTAPVLSVDVVPTAPSTEQEVHLVALAEDADAGIERVEVFVDDLLVALSTAGGAVDNPLILETCTEQTPVTGVEVETDPQRYPQARSVPYLVRAVDENGVAAVVEGAFTVSGVTAGDPTPPVVEVDPLGSPTVQDEVVITARATDEGSVPTVVLAPQATDGVLLAAAAQDEGGIDVLEIVVEGRLAARCRGVAECSTTAQRFPAGTVGFAVTATDRAGNSATRAGTFEVRPLGQPPQAVALVGPMSGAAPLLPRFDASLSSDPDGEITRYEWEFGDGERLSTTDVVIDHLYRDPGEFLVSLTVFDDDGNRTTTAEPVVVEVLANTAPVALPDEATLPTVAGSATVTGNVLDNDRDAEDDARGLPIRVITPYAGERGRHGRLDLDAEGNFSYTLDAGAESAPGEDSFPYAVEDSGGLRTVTSLRIIIPAPATGDLAPVALCEVSPLTGDVTTTFRFDAGASFDPDGAIERYLWRVDGVGAGESPGAVALEWSFDAPGRYLPTLRVVDGGGNVTEVDCDAVEVFAQNGPPQAVDDEASTSVDRPVTIEVLANDSDPDGDELTVDRIEQVSDDADVVPGAGDALIYTPPSGRAGPDGFSYTVCDPSGACASARVRVEIVNGRPVASDLTVRTREDTPVDLLLEGNDEDGTALTYRLVDEPSDGSLSGTAPSLRYTPAPDFAGTDQFRFEVSDGIEASEPGTVTLEVEPVNDPPVASFAATVLEESCGGAEVVFDAGASADPEGEIATYRWTVAGDTQTSDRPTLNVSLSAPGAYEVTLVVVDDEGASSRPFVSTLVLEAPPALSAELSAAPLKGDSPLSVEFDAGASRPADCIAFYRWDFRDGVRETTTEPTVRHTFKNGTGDEVTCRAAVVVVDRFGNESEPARVVVRVGPSPTALGAGWHGTVRAGAAFSGDCAKARDAADRSPQASRSAATDGGGVVVRRALPAQ